MVKRVAVDCLKHRRNKSSDRFLNNCSRVHVRFLQNKASEGTMMNAEQNTLEIHMRKFTNISPNAF